MPAFCESRAIERHVTPWTALDWPLRPEALFGRVSPAGIELGFGNGEFLVRLASERPEIDWIGVEISWVSIQRLLRRLDYRGLENVRVIQGDAAFVLERCFDPGSFQEIHINHPDPWPKKRHHDRRLIQPRFLSTIADRLTPEGMLTIATDHAAYADWIAEVLEGQNALAPAFGATRLDAWPGRAPTKYERKALSEGLKIHYFAWMKAVPGTPVPSEKEQVGTMPNVLLDGTLTVNDLLPGFEPETQHLIHGDVSVVIRMEGVYASSRRTGLWLVEVRLQEGGFAQHFAVEVVARSDGKVLVKPSSIGHPRPTWGVKESVRRVAELVVRAHPGLAIHSSGVGEVAAEPRG